MKKTIIGILALTMVVLMTISASALIDMRSLSYQNFGKTASSQSVVPQGGTCEDRNQKCVWAVQPWGYQIMGVCMPYGYGDSYELRCGIPSGSSHDEPVKQSTPVAVSSPPPVVTPPEDNQTEPEPPAAPELVCRTHFKNNMCVKQQRFNNDWLCTERHTYIADVCVEAPAEPLRPDFICGDWDYLLISGGDTPETDDDVYDGDTVVRTCGEPDWLIQV